MKFRFNYFNSISYFYLIIQWIYFISKQINCIIEKGIEPVINSLKLIKKIDLFEKLISQFILTALRMYFEEEEEYMSEPIDEKSESSYIKINKRFLE